MMRAFYASVLFLSMSQPLSAAGQPTWIVDTDESSVFFEYVEGSDTKTGSFDQFEALIAFDPDMPSSASASFVVTTASLDLDDTLREGVLATLPWFDSERFPQAEFTLKELTPDPAGGFVAMGVLRIKTVEMPVQVRLSLALEGDAARAMGTLEIDRRDFMLRDVLLETIVAVGEKVKIGFDLVARMDRN